MSLADSQKFLDMKEDYLSFHARRLREKADKKEWYKLIRVKVIPNFKNSSRARKRPQFVCYITQDDTPDSLKKWIRDYWDFDGMKSRLNSNIDLRYLTISRFKHDPLRKLDGKELPRELIVSRSNSEPTRIIAGTWGKNFCMKWLGIYPEES